MFPRPLVSFSLVLVLVSLTISLTACGGNAGGATPATTTPTPAQPANAPTVTLTANPTTVTAGQFTNLQWSSSNATTLTILPTLPGADTTPLALSGNAAVAPASTTTYVATAKSASGVMATASVLVMVSTAPPPAAQVSITITATPDIIAPGGSSTLKWQSQNAASVTIQPVIPGCAAAPCPVAVNGTATVSPPQTTTYTVTATDAAGHIATALRIVNVSVNNAGLQAIKHIIFLAQENHSFDNYFGQLGAYKVSRNLPNDIDGLPANTVQLDALKAQVHPYHQQSECIEAISPSWNPSWGAFDLNGFTLAPGPGVGGNILVGGTPGMDGFVNDKDLPTTIDPQYHRVMGYYDQTDLPYYYEAAAQFATSDRWFSPVLAGTIPNRLYLFTGTSFGHAHDDQPPAGGWTQPMIFDLLNQHGVSWRYYLQDPANTLGQFAEWGDQVLINSHVFSIDNWFTTLASPTADTDLPSVVFIEHAGNTGLDEHPGNNIQLGAARVAEIINALMASPAWQSSVFILTYDEFGGYYDHVPPLNVPAPDNIAPMETPGIEALLPGDFVHSGFRLPLIIFSPWVKPHFVSHVPRDSTSWLKLVEVRFGLPALTARDAAADDMTEFFDFTAPHLLTPPPLPAQPTSGACNFSIELLGQN